MHAHLFTLGMVLAVLHVEHRDRRLRLPRNWRLWSSASGIAILIALGYLTSRIGIPGKVETTAVAIPCAILLALVVLPPERLKRLDLIRVLEMRPVVVGGVISYSVYLWHMPVLLFARSHGWTFSGGWVAFGANLAAVATITYALSACTYLLVERPALRRKRAARVTAPGVPAAVAEAAAP